MWFLLLNQSIGELAKAFELFGGEINLKTVLFME
jgi:hypothetical protein